MKFFRSILKFLYNFFLNKYSFFFNFSGNEPINATRYTNCCHFFCKECIKNDLKCVICNIPVRPLEICNDHLIKSLVSYCNNIAEIIQERYYKFVLIYS